MVNVLTKDGEKKVKEIFKTEHLAVIPSNKKDEFGILHLQSKKILVGISFTVKETAIACCKVLDQLDWENDWHFMSFRIALNSIMEYYKIKETRVDIRPHAANDPITVPWLFQSYFKERLGENSVRNWNIYSPITLTKKDLTALASIPDRPNFDLSPVPNIVATILKHGKAKILPEFDPHTKFGSFYDRN